MSNCYYKIRLIMQNGIDIISEWRFKGDGLKTKGETRMEHLSVAIADDNQRILDMLDDIIQTDKELDLVGKAKNGEEMCQIIKDRQPDVVLLDLIMPKMDGLTVMEQVNKQEFVDKRPYFIVLTAVGQEKLQKMHLIKVQITIL